MTAPTGTREWTFPASFAQERIWMANQLDPDSPVYNVTSAMALPAGITGEQATAAFATVVARHEVLRTHLRLDDGDLVQVVHETVPVEPAVIDLRGLDRTERDRRMAILDAELCRTAIPLDRPPLWRAQLVRSDEADWALVLVAHHAVFDDRSGALLRAEITELCRAMLTGTGPVLPELPIQYADFAAWQRERVAGSTALAYWRDRLTDAPALSAPPPDRPRPARPGFAGDEVEFPLPDGLLDRVTRLGRTHRATPSAVLLAALAALLCRTSGGTDLVVGLSMAGRDVPEVESLLGMFVNPVPVRCDASADPTFAELVDRVRVSVADALDHGDVPFQHIVEAVAPVRDPAVQPVYQVAFNYLPAGRLDVPLGTTKDDLAFDITARHGRLLYRTDLYERSTAEAVVRRYLRLLTAAVAGPDTRLSELPLLDDDERDRVLAADDGPVRARLVPELFAEVAAAHPDRTALVTGDGSLSYRELAERAHRLARTLAGKGVRPDTRVALLLPRSADLVVAVLGVLAAGGGYVPIDVTYPAERIRWLLADSAPAVVLAAPDTVGLAPGALLVGDAVAAPDTAEPEASPAGATAAGPGGCPVRPDGTAYVLYTSGSTGTPKGVVVEHRSVAAYLDWARDRYPGLAGTALLPSPLAFDLTVTGLLGTLTAGGTVRLAGLDEAAARAGGPPSFLKTTPGQLPLLDADLSPTGELVLGGEALTAAALADWRRDRPGVTVVNEYGPTEATVGCVAATVAPGERLADGPVPIGAPVPGARVYVLDEALRPVPPGVTGELYVAGGQVARGYLHRPGRTAERFLPCPYGPPGDRMYATGDLARWRADGALDYLGRADRQLKVRGIRVEPAEVEAVLRAGPGVRQAAVAVRDGTLVGYVVGAPDAADGGAAGPVGGDPPDGGGGPVGGGIDTDALRAAAARVLPDHLVPAAVLRLDALPLTPNGKLDVDALPAAPVAATGYVAPRTEAERLVAEVYAGILGAERVGALDDFFALGGNSLRGMRAMARIRAEVGVEVPMRALFGAPVVADLAVVIEDALAAEVDAMSDGEVAALLAEEGGPA